MTVSVVPIDFKDTDEANNKQALKNFLHFFIGQKAAVKIEITKTDPGYHAEFSAEDDPPALVVVAGTP